VGEEVVLLLHSEVLKVVHWMEEVLISSQRVLEVEVHLGWMRIDFHSVEEAEDPCASGQVQRTKEADLKMKEVLEVFELSLLDFHYYLVEDNLMMEQSGCSFGDLQDLAVGSGVSVREMEAAPLIWDAWEEVKDHQKLPVRNCWEKLRRFH